MSNGYSILVPFYGWSNAKFYAKYITERTGLGCFIVENTEKGTWAETEERPETYFYNDGGYLP